VIAEDVAKVLESGSSVVIVGTVDSAGAPEATRAWGVRVLPGSRRVRVLLPSNDSVTIANVRATGAIAVTATDVPTLDSVQAKGRAAGADAATDDDRRLTDWYQAKVARAIHETDGTPLELVERMYPADVVAVEVAVDEVYDQTPGPNAGRKLG
jgi:hypothetical protein